MFILIDRANVDTIKETLKCLSTDGVATNPSILYHEDKEPLEVLHNIRAVLPATSQLHVQIVPETAGTMADKMRALRSELGGNLLVKLSVACESPRAIPLIVAEDMQVTATGIYSSTQGFMATKAGARYVAPCVNHMDNYGIDDVRATTGIHKTLRPYGLGADVLAASLKNSERALELVRQGAGATTTAPGVLETLIKNPVTNTAVTERNCHFDILVGSKRSWKDLIDKK